MNRTIPIDTQPDTIEAQQGLKPNLSQFALLVLITGFVGGMVGLERSILPEIAQSEFALGSNSAILSFIIAFGLSKAVSNYVTGAITGRVRKKTILVAGWVFALPVPFILISATNWNAVLFANVLLGINQGLAWSSTVMMKIDMVGQKNRGLAMGINEFAGYVMVGIFAFLSSYIAELYGLRPVPFYLGIGLAITGLVTSVLLVRDTQVFVRQEVRQSTSSAAKGLFWNTTWKNPNLGSATQAGLINNLNDGMVWGLLPLFLISRGFDGGDIGMVVGLYPIIWGIGQVFTGRLSDVYSHRKILFWGMLIQGVAIALFVGISHHAEALVLAASLGLGTALVYPTFLVVIARHAHPSQRSESIGVFRFWRDLGYVFGALVSGGLADKFGLESAMLGVALLTVASSVVILVRMKDPEDTPDATVPQVLRMIHE